MFSLFTDAQQYNTNVLRQKSITLRRFLEQNHFQPLQWNDSASIMLYDRWMKLLDDDKLIFSKTAIAQLTPYSTRLDDEMMGREWNFYNKSIALYKASLLRVDSVIKALLAKPLDFSTPDILNWPLITNPSNSSGIYQTWQQYLKWKVLRAITDILIDTSTSSITDYTKLPANFTELETKARAQIKKQELMWVQNK